MSGGTNKQEAAMTAQEINALKREHNRLQDQGRRAYEEVSALYAECVALQKRIEEAEGDDYDPIPLLFGAGFYVDPE